MNKNHKIKLKLIESRKHQCDRCLNTSWQDSPISLELHHMDGNKTNNTDNNLQLLCPNCHALTPNYRGKNIRKTSYRKISDQALIESVKMTSSRKQALQRVGLSTGMENYTRLNNLIETHQLCFKDKIPSVAQINHFLKSRKANRPIKEELEREVWELPSSQLAKKYGVSDKAIEKWCKFYGISKPARGHWMKLGASKGI